MVQETFIPALILFFACFSNSKSVLVDLSHVLDSNARNWPIQGYKKYSLSTLVEHDEGGLFYISKDIEMTEHIGTHMDAPHHFGRTSWDLAAIPIENFVVPLVKIDVRGKCASNPDYALTVQDLKDWEEVHGTVKDGAVVVMETGWGDKYNNTQDYYGTGRDLNAADFDYDAWAAELHFPGFSYDVSVELLENYKISGVGIDTGSIDPGNMVQFPAHFLLQGANKYGLENLCCLDQVPENGATLMAIPPKVSGGSGFTIRPLVDTDSTFAYTRNLAVLCHIATPLILGMIITWTSI